jgi:predicted Zn-dependent peptidase
MFKKISLDNNIPLLLEATKELRSVCIGIWVKVGSRYEKENKNGISHFLEHMYFKGTEGRSARDIAIESDSLGGELNAFTSTEYTLFYIKVLNEYIEKAADLLTDIFLNATFPESDIEKEKNIVLEEIKMVEDNPGDYVHDLFCKNIWGEEGLGQSILGSKETIDSFTRKDLSEHIEQHYGTNDIVVACSGNFQEDELVGYLNRTMGQLKREGGHVVKQTPHYRGGVNIITKEMSESHICLGLRGLPYVSDQRYVLHLLNTILGSGFSSRLFQNIRENRGLAYSIYSFHSAFFDTGLWSVYAGTDRSHVSEVVNISVDEIRGLSGTVTVDDLERAKSQLKGNLVLALESTSNKMTNIAKQEIYYGKYFTPDEIIGMVESVTLDNIKDLAAKLAGDEDFALTVYGPVHEDDIRGSCKLFR